MMIKDIGSLVILKNNQFIIFNKPVGLSVQEDQTGDRALINLAEIYCKSQLYPVHRIDRPASGLVLFAKNKATAAKLSEQFQQNKVQKKYLAVVGQLPAPPSAELSHYLLKNGKQNKSYVSSQDHSEAKLARLHYKHIGSIDRYHLLEVALLNGRHHQIRAQLAAIDCPIKGDVKYGFRRKNKDRSIHLHAWQLHFQHPVSKEEIQIEAPVPLEDPVWNAFTEHLSAHGTN
jgi:23S rRNA pseudouridine1911/1915/1917 synthase